MSYAAKPWVKFYKENVEVNEFSNLPEMSLSQPGYKRSQYIPDHEYTFTGLESGILCRWYG